MSNNSGKASNNKAVDKGAARLRATSSPSALLALGCIGLMVGAAPAAAQPASAPVQLGPVSVSADSVNSSPSLKSTAPLLNTPQTVSVLSQQLIRERGARTLADVLRNTPGISFDAGENAFGTSSNNFTLRGFDTSGSVFVDNFRDSGSYARDIFNVESVEVVKGAAADNGRGSAGGYVNLNTKTPLLSDFVAGDVSVGFDEYNSEERKRASVDVNRAIGENTAIRLNAVLEDSGVPGRYLAKNKLWGIAPSIATGLGTEFRASLSWEHLHRDDRPDWGVPGATIPKKVSFDPATDFSPATAGAPRDGFYGLRTDFDRTTSDAVTGRLDYDISDNLTVTNHTRWAQVDRDARFTTPNGFTVATLMVPTGTNFYSRINSSLSNITNLSATFDTSGIAHTVSAGIEVTSERSKADRPGAAVPAPGNTPLFNPNPNRVGAAPFAPFEMARTNVDTVAFYLYDTIVLSDQFQITAGIRGENYDVKLASLTAAGTPITPPSPANNYQYDEFAVSGKVGLVYKPVENASVYASFGTSTLPPGSYLSNPDISRTGDNAFPGFVPNAKAIRSENYEIGVKWDFLEGALSTTAALFRTVKSNIPVVGRDVAAGDPAGTNALRGYHEQVVEGIELGVVGAITPEWNVYGGLLAMDSSREISPYLDAVRRAGASGAGDYGTATSTNGDKLAFTPHFSANLWSTYRLPFGLTVGGGLQHNGSVFLGRPDDASRIIPNGRYGELRAYTVVNAMLAYEVTQNIDVRLNIDNIADNTYAATTNWNGSRATLGNPRTFLLSTGFRF